MILNFILILINVILYWCPGKNRQGCINTLKSMLLWRPYARGLAMSGGQVEWPAQGQRPWITTTLGRTGRRSVRPRERRGCRYGPWRGPLTTAIASQSIASSTSLRDELTIDFAFFAISLNINKKASSSIPKIPNYPQMTFLFCNTLVFNLLGFKVWPSNARCFSIIYSNFASES